MNRNNLIPLLIVLVITIGFLYQNGFHFQMVGFTTLSLSDAEFTSNLPGLSCNKGWILTVSQGGLGQSAVGTISKESIGDKSGVEPAHDLSISMNNEKLVWEYPIHVDYASDPVYKYVIHSTKSWNPLFDVDKWVKENCPNVKWYGKFVGTPITYWCIDKIQETSYMGYLDNCDVHFKTNITVETRGDKYSTYIDNRDEISKKIGDYVYVVWNGNLLKKNCPSQSPYKPFYENGWKLGYNEYYTNYKIQHSNFLQDMDRYIDSCNGIFPPKECNIDSLSRKVNNINSVADKFLTTSATFGSVDNKDQKNSAYVEVYPNSDVQVPVFTFYVCADWLGIYQPEPIPRIIDSRGTTFKSGEYGEAWVKFTNDGDDGNFEIWIDCPSPFNSIDTTKTISCDSGENCETKLKVGANTNERITRTCTIHVKGAGTNNEDTTTVTVTADPQKVCNPYDKVCDENQIKQCNSAGSGWNVIQTCPSGYYCTYRNGQPVCVSGSQPIPPSPTPSGKINWVKVFALLSGLIAFLSMTREDFRKKNWMGIFYGLMVGIVVGVMMYFILDNIIKIILASVIGAVIGGVVIWIFGPILVALAGIIGNILRGFEGGR